jgi:3-hydroxyanthranilate 3,4-dioxygenase
MTSIKPIVQGAVSSAHSCGPRGCGAGGGAAPARAVNEFGDPTGLDVDGGVAAPVQLMQWIAENRHLMVPPVGNKYLYSGKDFFVMIIAGPNARNDFHMTDSEEFFVQLKGDITVRIRDKDGLRDVRVREGETFFIPPGVPHSPQRGPDTLGLVVERRRPETEPEHLMFFCEKCGELVYDKVFCCKDIVQHFKRAMEEFWADEKLCTCRKCGTRVTRPY